MNDGTAERSEARSTGAAHPHMKWRIIFQFINEIGHALPGARSNSNGIIVREQTDA